MAVSAVSSVQPSKSWRSAPNSVTVKGNPSGAVPSNSRSSVDEGGQPVAAEELEGRVRVHPGVALLAWSRVTRSSTWSEWRCETNTR